jgi:hypothetical protein
VGEAESEAEGEQERRRERERRAISDTRRQQIEEQLSSAVATSASCPRRRGSSARCIRAKASGGSLNYDYCR